MGPPVRVWKGPVLPWRAREEADGRAAPSSPPGSLGDMSLPTWDRIHHPVDLRAKDCARRMCWEKVDGLILGADILESPGGDLAYKWRVEQYLGRGQSYER